MTHETISIIIPVYNAEAYLDKCLMSLVKQTYSNIEVLCVDDGSTDRSLSILQTFSEMDKRIKVFHQSNKGVSCARNKGLKHAMGTYIMFLDADDYFSTTAAQECIECMKSQRVDLVIFNCLMFYPNGSSHLGYQGGLFDKIPSKLYGEDSEFLSAFNNVCFMCFSRSIIEKNSIRFSEGHIYEDWEFAAHYLSVTDQCCWHNHPLYFYRVGQNYSISNIVDNRCLDIFRTLEQAKAYFMSSHRWENNEFCFYLKAFLHLLSFFHTKILNASKDIKKSYWLAMHNLISSIPFVYLAALGSHFSETERQELFLIYTNADIQAYYIYQKKTVHIPAVRRVRNLIKATLYKILPAYRVSSIIRDNVLALRYEQNAHWDTIEKTLHTYLEQDSIATQINALTMQIHTLNQQLNDLEDMILSGKTLHE